MKAKRASKKNLIKHDRAGSECRIKNAALEVFAKRGYAAATTRMVANKAKLNVSLISRYFGGKEQLFKKILQEQVEKLIQIDLEYPAQDTLEKELKEYFRSIFRAFEKNISFHRIAVVQAILDQKFAKFIEASKNFPYDNRLRIRLENLKTSGKIKTDVNIDILNAAISSFVSNEILNWMLIFRKSVTELEGHSSDFISILNRKLTP